MLFSFYTVGTVTGLIKPLLTVFFFSLVTPALAADEDSFTILAFGDSLTAGYGLPDSEALPAQLEAELGEAGVDARVINAGVSGDTTSGGLARLAWTLDGETGDGESANGESGLDLVILALGANDALRGIEPALTRENLRAMITQIQARGIPVLLAGMIAPPNMGAEYGAAYNPIFEDLAREYDVPLYPFLLDGVAANPALNQGDGMHPNAAGVAMMAARIAPVLRKLLTGDNADTTGE